MKIIKVISIGYIFYTIKNFLRNSLFIKRNRATTIFFAHRIFIEHIKHTENQTVCFIDKKKNLQFSFIEQIIPKNKYNRKIEISFFIKIYQIS
jgi:hypothetical protein